MSVLITHENFFVIITIILLTLDGLFVAESYTNEEGKYNRPSKL